MHSLKKQLPFCFTFFLIIIAYQAILRSPLLYGDDALRVYTFETINQGVHGRPFADILYMFFTGGIFVDFSPLSQLIALFCMALSGYIIYNTFTILSASEHAEATTQQCLTTLVFSVFPLHYATISFKFDSPSFGAAIVCAVSAFALSAKDHGNFKKNIYFSLISGLLLAVSLGLYQPMFGIYTCSAVFFLGNMLLNNTPCKKIIQKIFLFSMSCFGAAVFYLPIFLYTKYMAQLDFHGIGPHPHVNQGIQLPKMREIISTILENSKKIFIKIYAYSGIDGPTIALVLLTMIFVYVVLRKKMPCSNKITTLLLLPLALIASFGVQVFLKNPLDAPRVTVSLSAFAACLTALVFIHTENKNFKKIVTVIVIYFIITSSVLLTAIGNAQRDQYTYQNDIIYKDLGIDLLHLYKNNGMKKFCVLNSQEPLCTSAQILEKKYGFVKGWVALPNTMFFMQKYLSYIPVKYFLKAHFQPQDDISQIPPTIERPNYFIKESSPGVFVVTLKTIAPIPFDYDRWLE